MHENPYQSYDKVSRVDTRTPNTSGLSGKIRLLIGRPILQGKILEESAYPPAIVSWMNAMRRENYSASQTSQFSPDSVMEVAYELGDNGDRNGTWFRVEYGMAFSNENCRGSRPEAMEFLIDSSGKITKTIEYHHHDLKRSSGEYIWKEEEMKPITLTEDQKGLVIQRISSLAVKGENPIDVDLDSIEATHVTTDYRTISNPRIECTIRIQGTLRKPVKMKYTGYDWTYDTKKFEGEIFSSNTVALKFHIMPKMKE
jgi:hypothetical protein